MSAHTLPNPTPVGTPVEVLAPGHTGFRAWVVIDGNPDVLVKTGAPGDMYRRWFKRSDIRAIGSGERSNVSEAKITDVKVDCGDLTYRYEEELICRYCGRKGEGAEVARLLNLGLLADKIGLRAYEAKERKAVAWRDVPIGNVVAIATRHYKAVGLKLSATHLALSSGEIVGQEEASTWIDWGPGTLTRDSSGTTITPKDAEPADGAVPFGELPVGVLFEASVAGERIVAAKFANELNQAGYLLRNGLRLCDGKAWTFSDGGAKFTPIAVIGGGK